MRRIDPGFLELKPVKFIEWKSRFSHSFIYQSDCAARDISDTAFPSEALEHTLDRLKLSLGINMKCGILLFPQVLYLRLSIFTATVITVSAFDIPYAVASTTFPNAPEPRVLPVEAGQKSNDMNLLL